MLPFLVPIRGLEKLEPLPLNYLLGVKTKITDEHPRSFHMGDPPPPPPGGASPCKSPGGFHEPVPCGRRLRAIHNRLVIGFLIRDTLSARQTSATWGPISGVQVANNRIDEIQVNRRAIGLNRKREVGAICIEKAESAD